MRGYVREYRPNKWSYTVYIGKVDGKPKKTEKGGFSSKKEAENALSVKLAELATTGEIFKPTDKTLQEVFEEFITSAQITRKPATVVKHKSIWKNHVASALGFRFLKTIKTTDIDKFIQSRADAGYSQQFVKSIFKCLFALFTFCIDREYLKTNPMLKATNPKVIKSPVEVFTHEELQKIDALLKTTNLHTSFIIAINTGMRIGEVFGLRWRNVDFRNNTITIDHQLLYEKGRYCIGQPKSEAGNRTIKMTAQLHEYLQELKKTQQKNRKLACELYKDNTVFNYFTNSYECVSDFVNVKPDGEFLTLNSAKYITRVCRDNGIKFHFHNLRHTHATTLLENGASIKMVQERLGHARPEITLNIYSHVTNKHEADILDRITML